MKNQKPSKIYLIRLNSKGHLKEVPREIFLSLVRDRLVEIRKRNEKTVYGAPLPRFSCYVEASTGNLRFVAKDKRAGRSGTLKSAWSLVERESLYRVKYTRKSGTLIPHYPLLEELNAQI